MGRLRLLLLAVLVPLVGCNSNAGISNWVRDHGGTVGDQRLERTRALTAMILRDRQDVRLQVSVLNRDDLSAFSWPNGQIFVSRGLVDALDDAALSAAIAHEIAHILNRHRAGTAAGLRSGDAPFAEEVRADRLAVDLLAACGVPPESMVRALGELLRRDDLPVRIQDDLRRRVQLLQRLPQLH